MLYAKDVAQIESLLGQIMKNQTGVDTLLLRSQLTPRDVGFAAGILQNQNQQILWIESKDYETNKISLIYPL